MLSRLFRSARPPALAFLALLFSVAAFAADQAAAAPGGAAAWVALHGPVIAAMLVALLPSVITGLTNFPQAGEATAVLKIVFSFLSLLTHKDAPGTFKLPLTPHADPSDAAPAAGPPGNADLRFLGILTLSAAGVVVFFAACSLWRPTLKADEVDCAEEAVAAAAEKAVPGVAAAVMSEGDGWEAELAAREAGVGLEAAVCAATALIKDFAPACDVNGPSNPTVDLKRTAVWRARTYVAKAAKHPAPTVAAAAWMAP